MITVFKNFKIIRHGEISPFCDLAVENGKIIAIGRDLTGERFIDGKGEYWLSAGFIDIHTHGGGGYDFMDADPDEYVKIARNHAKYGATSLYPTTVAASREELLATIKAFDEASKKNDGANMLGIHLEGPYISPEQAGAMDPKYIREPKREEYEELFALSDNIRRMTIAPELHGTAELGIYMKERGIIGSIGHTNAIAEQVTDAHYEGGYDLLTHMYSCMNMTKRQNGWRRAGAVEAAYLLDDMYVEAIADGCHLPKELLQLMYRIKGEDHMILVTDSMRAAGLKEGVYRFGSRANGYDIIVEDGVAKLMDRTAFAGSVATPDRLVRTMVRVAQVPLTKAIKMITETPAKAMGIYSERGSLDDGKAADITVFDDNVRIQLTMVGGETVYKKN